MPPVEMERAEASFSVALAGQPLARDSVPGRRKVRLVKSWNAASTNQVLAVPAPGDSVHRAGCGKCETIFARLGIPNLHDLAADRGGQTLAIRAPHNLAVAETR